MLKHIICFALFFVVGINCQSPTKCPTFSCYDDKSLEDKVLLFGSTNVTCPKTTVCNRFGLDNCTPCIGKGALCRGKYSCKAANGSKTDTIVQIGDLEFVCPNNFVCQPPNEECIPCSRGKCPPEQKQFRCDENNPTIVIFIGEFEASCKDSKVCNSRWESPCNPCVTKEETSTLSYVNYLTRLVK